MKHTKEVQAIIDQHYCVKDKVHAYCWICTMADALEASGRAQVLAEAAAENTKVSLGISVGTTEAALALSKKSTVAADAAEAEVKRLTGVVDGAAKQLRELGDERDTLKNTLSTAMKGHWGLCRQRDRMQVEAIKLQDDLNDAVKEAQSMKDDRDEARDRSRFHREQRVSAEKLVVSLRKSNCTLQAQLSDKAVLLKDIGVICRENDELQTLRANIKNLTDDNRKLSGLLAGVNAANAGLQQAVVQQCRRGDDLHKLLNTTSGDVERLTEINRLTNKDNQALKDAAQLQRELCDSVIQEARKLRARNDSLAHGTHDLKVELSATHDLRKAALAEVRRLAAENKRLDDDNFALAAGQCEHRGGDERGHQICLKGGEMRWVVERTNTALGLGWAYVDGSGWKNWTNSLSMAATWENALACPDKWGGAKDTRLVRVYVWAGSARRVEVMS